MNLRFITICTIASNMLHCNVMILKAKYVVSYYTLLVSMGFSSNKTEINSFKGFAGYLLLRDSKLQI